MKVSIIAYNKPVQEMPDALSGMENDLKYLAGAAGGVCYMKDKFFGTYVSDPEKAVKRFGTVAATGHHSIAGHAQVSLLLEDIPKIVAMYLNNLRDYETSEKSGRYTVMTGSSELERSMYEKWKEIFKELIVCEYPASEGTLAEKLAMENARYMLSVFTPTTMVYTASLRQLNYIIKWAEDLYEQIMEEENISDFAADLAGSMKKLSEELKELVYVPELAPFKSGGGFDMIAKKGDLNFGSDKTFAAKTRVFGNFYRASYFGTFAQYAQAQRHRTIVHHMAFTRDCPKAILGGVLVDAPCYIPPILKTEKNAGYGEEWIRDFKEISKECVPQGTLVEICEEGRLDDFFLKMQERCCGRAQLEIAHRTAITAHQIYVDLTLSQKEKYAGFYKATPELEMMPKAKCELLSCKEPCIFGVKSAYNRFV